MSTDPGDIDPDSATNGLVEKIDLESHLDPMADVHSKNFDKIAKDFLMPLPAAR